MAGTVLIQRYISVTFFHITKHISLFFAVQSLMTESKGESISVLI